MLELKSFLNRRKPVAFLDLFAGAGGISRGLLQADANDKHFDFLALDIIVKSVWYSVAHVTTIEKW